MLTQYDTLRSTQAPQESLWYEKEFCYGGPKGGADPSKFYFLLEKNIWAKIDTWFNEHRSDNTYFKYFKYLKDSNDGVITGNLMAWIIHHLRDKQTVNDVQLEHVIKEAIRISNFYDMDPNNPHSDLTLLATYRVTVFQAANAHWERPEMQRNPQKNKCCVM
jgi:hypothetical protein